MPNHLVTDQNGVQHSFPDEATPEMIAQALNVKPPITPQQSAAQAGPATSIGPQPQQPGFMQRLSQATLGTQHPLQEIGREAKDIYRQPAEGLKNLGEIIGLPRSLWSDPANNVQNIGGTGIPGMAFGEQGFIKHPLAFMQNLTGANQAAEDVQNKNYSGALGDIAGGVTNLAMAKKPVEGAGREFAEAGRNAKAGIADVVRTPENKLTPSARALAKVGGAIAGHGLGVPGYGELGGLLTGPSLADAFLPKRPEPPNFRGGAYTEMEPLEGQVTPITKSPNYSQYKAAQKAVNAPPPVPSPFGGMTASDRSVGNAPLPFLPRETPFQGPQVQMVDKFSAPQKSRIVTPESEPPDVKVTYQSVPQPDLLRLVKSGDRAAINEWQRRGLQLPENVGFMTEGGAGRLPWRNYGR